MKKLVIIAAILLLPLAANAISFTTAKNKMYSKVFNNQGETFYCGCDWSNRKTDLKSCGLQSYFPKKQRKRANRTEAEHLIPASWGFSPNNVKRACFIQARKEGVSPRKLCQKIDADYKRFHNDLVNLTPAVGQVNADRSNKPFVAKVKNKVKTYGSCPIKIGSRGIEPPKDKRGDIARIAFYLSDTYQLTYSKRQTELFIQWENEDPVSREEKAHHDRVIKAQGFGLKL